MICRLYPLLILLSIGTIFFILGFLALFRIRREIKRSATVTSTTGIISPGEGQRSLLWDQQQGFNNAVVKEGAARLELLMVNNIYNLVISQSETETVLINHGLILGSNWCFFHLVHGPGGSFHWLSILLVHSDFEFWSPQSHHRLPAQKYTNAVRCPSRQVGSIPAARKLIIIVDVF